jgi:hypothetical protein
MRDRPAGDLDLRVAPSDRGREPGPVPRLVGRWNQRLELGACAELTVERVFGRVGGTSPIDVVAWGLAASLLVFVPGEGRFGVSVLSAIRDELGSVVAGLDPDVLAPEAAAGMVRELVAIERLAGAGKLLVLGRVVGSGVWKSEGARSEAHWLAKQAGISLGHARGLLAAAESVREVPAVEAAVRRGELSEPQVQEIAPAAAADPSAAAELLDSARDEAFGKLKERCARVRAAAADDETRDDQIVKNRHLRITQDPDGAGRIEGTGPCDVLARLRARLDPYRDLAFKHARAEGRVEHADAYSFDALKLWLDDLEHRPSDEPGVTRTRTSRRNPDAEVIVLADLSALKRGHTVPGETCEIAGFGPVSVAAARELMGDAALRIVLKDGVDIRNITHAKRTINQVLHTALLAGGWVCGDPDCACRHRLDRDHLHALANGGATTFFNLGLKCQSGCHQQKTEHDMRQLRQRTARRRQTAPAQAGPAP